MNPSNWFSETENQAKQLRAWKDAQDNDLFASWKSTLDTESISAFDQAVDRRGTLSAQNPDNYWRFMHKDVDSESLLREEQWLAATYHWPEVVLLGAATAGSWAFYRCRASPNRAIAMGAVAMLTGSALQFLNAGLVRGDAAYAREAATRDTFRVRLYVHDLDRRKLVIPLRAAATALVWGGCAAVSVGLLRRPRLPTPAWAEAVSAATGLPSTAGSGLPRTLPRSRHIPWGAWPPEGTHVYDNDVSFAKVQQLQALAQARWRVDHPESSQSEPPPRELYFYTRLCLRELLTDMHGSEAAAKAAVRGKSMLQALAPSTDLAWIEGVLPQEEEAALRGDILRWEREFNEEHGVWSEGTPHDLEAYEAFLDEKEHPEQAAAPLAVPEPR